MAIAAGPANETSRPDGKIHIDGRAGWPGQSIIKYFYTFCLIHIEARASLRMT